MNEFWDGFFNGVRYGCCCVSPLGLVLTAINYYLFHKGRTYEWK